MLNPAARRWFGMKYKVLLDMGIDGFWNDMNEPAIFYSEKRLNQVLDQAAEFKGKNLDLEKTNQLLGLFSSLANNPEDYRSFYHEPGNTGERIRHDKVHNLYGYNMTRAAGEAFEELEPDKRILMFSRSSYVGMHRYGVHLAGRQSFLVVPSSDERKNDAFSEHVRFPLHRSGSGRFRRRHHRRSAAALASVRHFHSP